MMMVMVVMKVMMMMVLTRFWRAATPPVREYEDEGTACGGCRHLNKSVEQLLVRQVSRQA